MGRCLVIPLLLLWVLEPSLSFPYVRTARYGRSRFGDSGTFRLHGSSAPVVFTRFSEDCQRAIRIAQEQAILSRRNELDEAFMLLGIVSQPGRAKDTLDKYRITWDTVRSILQAYQSWAVPAATRNSSDVPCTTVSLADLKATRNQALLVYSRSLQERFMQAARISALMGDAEVDVEHVLLGLLRYQEDVTTGEAMAATRGDDSEAMEVIYHIDATLDGVDICQDLLQRLLEWRRNHTNGNEPSERTLAPTETRHAHGDAPARTSAVMSGAPPQATSSSLLEEFGIDLTQQAKEGMLDIVHGRQEEIESCLRVLLRRKKNNVCLVGMAGTGKTSIAEGLAQILVSDLCPALLKGYRMVSLDVGSLLSGTKFRGAFEERFRGILQELTEGSDRQSTRTILFLDEMHTLMGSGGTDGVDAANLLKPYLSRGKLKVIGATTLAEYRKIAKDAAMDRRFQPVLVREPSVRQTIDILKALAPFYSAHHRVEFQPASLEAAAKLSDRYITDRFLPDKAIDLMDEAGALASLRRIPNHDAPEVDETLMAEIISDLTSIPVGALQMDEMERLEALEKNLSNRVQGQERAVKAVAKAIRRSRTGVGNPSRPIASLLFCGPTGTGKTELCKALAAEYYGSERNMIRIDMSEYAEKFTITRLTGPPPGFVGYEDGGVLTEAVRRNPHSVILLDELEKAHPDVLNILLQVVDDGILTDGTGQTISFKNSVIIMTSNLGSKRILETIHEKPLATAKQPAGDSSVYSKLARVVKGELEAFMKPEFLNRIDEIVVFQPLTDKELYGIASRMSYSIAARAKIENDIDISISSSLLRKIVMEGSKAASKFGARPMRRAVQYILEDALSDTIIKRFLVAGDRATFDLRQDKKDSFTEDGMRRYFILVQRVRGNKTLTIEIEESCRDLEAETENVDDSAATGVEPNGAPPRAKQQPQSI